MGDRKKCKPALDQCRSINVNTNKILLPAPFTKSACGCKVYKPYKKCAECANGFAYATLTPNTFNSVNIPIAVEPAVTTLAVVTLQLRKSNSRVLINATAGILVNATRTVTYQIYKNSVAPANLIFSTQNYIETPPFDQTETDSFTHVDLAGAKRVTYILTAGASEDGVTAVGPITFSALEV